MIAVWTLPFPKKLVFYFIDVQYEKHIIEQTFNGSPRRTFSFFVFNKIFSFQNIWYDDIDFYGKEIC